MANDAYTQREACVIVALNVLCGTLKPEQWRGLTRLDEDEEAALSLLRQVRHWGFGKVEMNVIEGRVDTAYKHIPYKRKDFLQIAKGA
jgi:hypothetical protein